MPDGLSKVYVYPALISQYMVPLIGVETKISAMAILGRVLFLFFLFFFVMVIFLLLDSVVLLLLVVSILSIVFLLLGTNVGRG